MNNIKLNFIEQCLSRLKNTDENNQFHYFYNKKSKNLLIAYTLLIFLGIFGLHKLYLDKKVGWLYFIFCWTMIPFILLIVDLFLLPFQVSKYNRNLAIKIVDLIKYYSNTGNSLMQIENKLNGSKTRVIEWLLAFILIFAVILPAVSYLAMTLSHHKLELHYNQINPDGSKISNIISF